MTQAPYNPPSMPHEHPEAENLPNAPGAVASLVLGLVGIVVFGLVLGVLAIIFAARALKIQKENPATYGGRGMAIAGLILGIVDIVGWIIYLAVYFT